MSIILVDEEAEALVHLIGVLVDSEDPDPVRCEACRAAVDILRGVPPLLSHSTLEWLRNLPAVVEMDP